MSDFNGPPNEAVAELHFMVTRAANHFVRQVSNFSIGDLSKHNPTYEDVAKDSRFIASILKVISNMDVHSEARLVENALQAAVFMERMAKAITQHDQQALTLAADELAKMCLI